LTGTLKALFALTDPGERVRLDALPAYLIDPPKADAAAPTTPAPPKEESLGSHAVSQIVIKYDLDNPSQPAPESVLAATLSVIETAEGFAPASGAAAGTPVKTITLTQLSGPDGSGATKFTDEGLAALAPAIVSRLKALGLVGVYVQPDAAEFRVQDGRVVDLRAKGVTTLTMIVTTGQVSKVRTIGIGERLPPDQTTDHPFHARIRARSPVQAYVEGEPKRSDLLRSDLINDYVFRLNRHPGRRADVAVSASGEKPGAVTLDYLVTENRPWLLFAQISNTGSASTDALREQFGFIHNDLSHHDDILSITYQTANFNKVHALGGSYDRPFGDSEHWRWKVYSSWYRYVASEVGQNSSDFKGEGYTLGGEAVWNFFQRHALFLDLAGGAKYDNIRVKNNIAATSGHEDFLIPYVQMRLERNTEAVRTNAMVGLEFNTMSADQAGLDNLGRLDADSSFSILRGEATHSFYIDPFFDNAKKRKGGLANEIVVSARALTSLGNRLIPNQEQTAGGLYTVRGYPESVVAGDDVMIASAEYRLHIPRGLSPRPTPGNAFGGPFRVAPQYEYGPTDWDLVVKAFIDAGAVRQRNKKSYEFDSDLVGVGIGAEIAITRRFNLRVDWGFALNEVTDNAGGRVVNSGHNELQFVLTVVY
jgi:hemolysin activation/secretion protein